MFNPVQAVYVSLEKILGFGTLSLSADLHVEKFLGFEALSLQSLWRKLRNFFVKTRAASEEDFVL